MKKTAFSVVLFIMVCFTATAQKDEPLSELHIQTSIVNPFYVSLPYNMYSVSPVALRFQIGANLHHGELYLAISRNKFNSDSLEGFNASLLTLGYSFNIPLLKKISIRPGAALGNNYIQFRNSAIPNAVRYESELMMEGFCHLQANLFKQVYASIGITAQRTFLYHRFDVINANVSLSYYFKTPKIIKKLID